MLCGSIYRDGKLIAEDAALNDITITSSAGKTMLLVFRV